VIKLITYCTTFLIIILAELGDKTQVATLIYASNHPQKRWQIFFAAALALITCVALEVTLGMMIARAVSPAMINRITGLIFLIIGIVILMNFLRIKAKEKVQQIDQAKELERQD